LGARASRYEKLAIAISMMSLAVSAIGAYASWSTSTEAVSIAGSAYSIANNYAPRVEVRSSTALELRPANCKPTDSSGNMSCSFRGTFNVSFLIIAAHVGTYNINIVAFNSWGNFSRHPVEFSDGGLVKIGNATISAYPPLQSVSSLGGVPAGQPLEKTVEVEVSGFTLTAPSSSLRNLNLQVVGGTLSAILTYSDTQEAGRDVQRLFIVQLDFLMM
jgi:hypothetical protein